MIDRVEADPNLEERDDVLSLMLQSRYEDGTAMSRSDLADELFTLLAAGHETTATQLAWAVERLRRHPGVLSRLVDEVDAGGSDLLQATINEVQRNRPVIDGAARQVIAPTMPLGQWVIPHGYTVQVDIPLTHQNAYPDPDRFDPDRFMESSPDLYSWVPFGGGTRRCLGAAFANMEMNVVLRTILREFLLVPTNSREERLHSRGVAFAPSGGGRAVVYRRIHSSPERRTEASGRHDYFMRVNSMRAVVITKHGDLSVLQVQERPDPPPPGPGQVRIAVRAAGVNFADHLARVGLYPDAPKPPAVVGYEVAGTIEAVGDGVDPARVGERVFAGTRFGGYAEIVNVQAADAVPLPDALSFEQGAAIPVNYATAWAALHGYGSLRSGERVLIHAAAGGVGIAAIQLAKAAGAEIHGTASPGKHSDSPSWASTAPSTTAATAGGKACRRTTLCWTPSAASR